MNSLWHQRRVAYLSKLPKQSIIGTTKNTRAFIIIFSAVIISSTAPVLSNLEQEIVLLTNEAHHGNTLKEGTTTTTTITGKTLIGSGVAGYLLAEATNEKLNKSNELDLTLANVLERNGPDMRPLRDFRDFDDITLDVAKRAWQLMHEHAKAAATDRLRLIEPIIQQTLMAANVSSNCLEASKKTMKAAQQLDSWAVQLLTSWGNFPPTGFFEGTLGDIGSFHGCVNVPINPIINHAHYCTIAYRPVMPNRRNYELIIKKEPDELLKLFDRPTIPPTHDLLALAKNDLYTKTTDGQPLRPSGRVDDALGDLLKHAQYNHYVYYKYGTCFPIQCTPHDVHKLAKLVGKRSILMSGPVKCHSKYVDDYEETFDHKNMDGKQINNTALQISTRDLNDGIYIWKPHMTQTQFVCLVIIGSITIFIVSLTLIDVFMNRIPEFYSWYKAKHLLSNRLYLNKIDNRYSKANTQMSVEMKYHFHHQSMLLEKSKTCDSNNNSADKITQIQDNPAKEPNDCNGNIYTNVHLSGREDLEGDIIDVKHNAIRDGQAQQTKRSNYKRKVKEHRSLFMELVDDYSIITSVIQFFSISQSQLKNDILCINGIRCITMSWIIITHTMQYNDWSAFARIYEVENHLKSLINQPLFNGSYLVDTFFLMSGLLTSFSSFRSVSNGGLSAKFSARSYLVGRYLRLTPQIMFISMLFIVLPQLSRSGGPHWYTITGEYSENCSQNWWINLFHIQAFYRSNEMCNFVCWWISVDMFYHLFGLAIILLVYYNLPAALTKASNTSNANVVPPTAADASSSTISNRDSAGSSPVGAGTVTLVSCIILIFSHGVIQVFKHYQLELPPNLLSTIPQTGAMWSKMTLEFFWTPYAHAFPFFFGFYIGYLMAQCRTQLTSWFNLNRALLGWILAISLVVIQSYSTYYWVIGRWQYSRITSTIFYLICPVVWSSCLTWIILACQYGYGSWINQLLSCRLFIVLGKASYIVYLSHFLVLFTFFGSQNLLLEPTQLVMSYVIIGNICLSMLLGSILCIIYEIPWLKTQKRLMKYIC